jgi:DNA invertase Pin-like site-specific DNA recombinase
MTKITPEQLTRRAIVYVRQSTAFQVTNNLESQRRQYGLVERARQLGWSEARVIDDDLGRSSAGSERPGFEKLLAAICEGNVGAVLSIEASRLARNGRNWHTLLEFCGVVGTLIVDEDGVYDPRSPNDRLLLGMKGTMSEMELSMFRQRSVEARKQKARRGELLLAVAVGYAKTDDGCIEKSAEALLPGLFRCARCGRKLYVAYGGTGSATQRYVCRGAFDAMAVASCISFGGMRIDRAIAQEVLDRLQPLGVEAALAAFEVHGQEQLQKRRQVENALEQARFEAARAHRQYDAADPENRLVAGELERRWNERLASVRMLEDQLGQITAQPVGFVGARDRERLLTLGADLTLAWNNPGVSVETRKKIIRLLICEIIVDAVGD